MELGNRGKGKGALLLLVLCTVVMLMLGFRGGVAKDSSIASAAAAENTVEINGIKDSLPLLTVLGREVTEQDSPLRLVLKWQGEYRSASSTTDAAKKLAANLGLGEVSRAEEDDHLIYRSTAELKGNTHISMFWNELGNGRSYVIVTFETLDLINATELQNAAEETGVIMQEIGIAAEWNASLQGVAQAQGAPKDSLLQIEQLMVDKLSGLKAVESYEDETTNSRSYMAPGLERFVSSGDHSIAVQIATHKDSNQERNRVTIGFPLITIEY